MIPKSGNCLLDSKEDREDIEAFEKNYLDCGCFRVCVCDEEENIYE